MIAAPRNRRWRPSLLAASVIALGACTGGVSATDEPSSDPQADNTTSSLQVGEGQATDDTTGSDPATTSESDTTNDTGPEATSSTTATPTRLTGSYSVEIVSSRPHDPDAFTQGLELHDGRLLESTGLYGESDRRWVDPQTGDVLEITPIDDSYFGEGITLVDGEIFQLTWREGKVLVADDALTELTFESYDGEGWGLCARETEFAMSNGSAELTFRDLESFEVTRTVPVIDADGNAINAINELECVGEQVLANIWGLDVIVAIDAETGAVDAVIDAAALRPASAPAEDLNFALNGIAYDAESGHYLLTGKQWDTLYEVALVPS